MDGCKLEGCRYQYGIINGYCRIHAGRARSEVNLSSLNIDNSSLKKISSSQRSQVTNNDLRDILREVLGKLDNITNVVAQLQQENIELANNVSDLNAENQELKREIGDLKCNQNKLFFKNDAQNQHGRHENFRTHNITETDHENCIDKVIDAVRKIGVTLTADDIQRCHRLGRPKSDGKPRAIICKLNYYPKKKEIMDKRKGLAPDLTGKSIKEKKTILSNAPFITEDLSPFRGKILRFVKDWNRENSKYDVVSTSYGKIVCKIKNTEKQWISITTTDDFLNAGIPYDKKFTDEFTELML